MLALLRCKLRHRQTRILSSPAPCELRVCEKWEVGEKLKRSHFPLSAAVDRPLHKWWGAGSRLLNTKHVIVIQQHRALRTGGGNTLPRPPHVGSTQSRTPGMWRRGHQTRLPWLPMLGGRGQVHAAIYFVAGAEKYETSAIFLFWHRLVFYTTQILRFAKFFLFWSILIKQVT